jgi:hypothetical protein
VDELERAFVLLYKRIENDDRFPPMTAGWLPTPPGLVPKVESPLTQQQTHQPQPLVPSQNGAFPISHHQVSRGLSHLGGPIQPLIQQFSECRDLLSSQDQHQLAIAAEYASGFDQFANRAQVQPAVDVKSHEDAGDVKSSTEDTGLVFGNNKEGVAATDQQQQQQQQQPLLLPPGLDLTKIHQAKPQHHELQPDLLPPGLPLGNHRQPHPESQQKPLLFPPGLPIPGMAKSRREKSDEEGALGQPQMMNPAQEADAAGRNRVVPCLQNMEVASAVSFKLFFPILSSHDNFSILSFFVEDTLRELQITKVS